MKLHSWSVVLGILGVSALAVAACSSSSSPATTTPGEDASTPEPDSGTPDTGTIAPDASDGATVVSDAGDAGSCSIGLDTGDATCNTCVETSCCTQLTTCDVTDDAGANDAGFSACEQLLACINDVNSTTDGGGEAGAGETACDGTYEQSEQTNAEAVLTCIRTSCATQCPGL
jgi:hypothetical protein